MGSTNPISYEDVTFEYLLPFEETVIRDDHQELFTPWFRRFFGSSPPRIGSLIFDEWKDFTSPTSILFRDHLSLRIPKSVVVDGGRIWMSLQLCDATDEYEAFLVHEPRLLSVAETDFLSEFNIDGLEDFCVHYFDAQECVLPSLNAMSMSVEPITCERFPKCGDWEGGIYLHYICSGDAILMAPDGRIGRWEHEIGWDDAPGYNRPCAVKDLELSFDDYVRRYVEYLEYDEQERRDTMFW